ncbi:MAG: hypothetical protein RLY86_2816 [Pseudomonadota bacterium]|jgi:hypothetical protein
MRKEVITALVLGLCAGAAQAQDTRGVSVSERPRPDYQSQGIRAGSFLVRPTVTLTGRYDDNVFAQDTDKQDDFITVIMPNVVAASTWSRHRLVLRGGAEIGIFRDIDSEDYDDYVIGTDIRLDATQGDFITGTAEYRREHEERGTANDVGGSEPTEFDVISARLGYERTGRRITLRVTGTLDEFDYDSTLGFGSVVLNLDFRDRTEYTLGSRVGYEFQPGVSAFVQGTLNWRDYANGIRNSDGYEVDVGLSFDLDGVTTGEVFAGYRAQTYDIALFQDSDGLTFGGTVLWLPTALTSVRLRVINEVNEAILPNASGFVSTGGSVQIDHELRPNILIGGLLGYTENDFEGVDRLEKLWNAEAKVEYLIDRNFRVGANYRLRDRDVNIFGTDYTRNQVMLTLRGAL